MCYYKLYLYTANVTLPIIFICVVSGFPNNVVACRGGEASFSCFVSFTSEVPSAASWIQNSGTNASLLPDHHLFDNSSSTSSLPAIVNNTLLITNVSSVESGYTYTCKQGGMMSDPASLTIIG